MTSRYKTWIELSSQAWSNTIQNLHSSLSPGVDFCAVVKANAYGHGLNEIVRLAVRQDIKIFAVDNLDEALAVRSLSPESIILILGYTPEARFPELVSAGLIPTVCEVSSLGALALAAQAQGMVANFNLKLETGLNRQGLIDKDVPRVLEILRQSSDRLRVYGLSSHLANSEDLENPDFTNEQLEVFKLQVQKFLDSGFVPRFIHIACSASGLTRLDSQFSMVRFGLAMYGLWPSTSVRRQVLLGRQRLEITPVLSWRTSVAQVKDLAPGAKVGYGLSYTANRPMRLAILPVGYYDGYDRRLSNNSEVIIRGTKCPVIGRICMNMCMADVSAVPGVQLGDQVTLIGRDGMQTITAEDLADRCQTINYEIVSRINPFLPRVIV